MSQYGRLTVIATPSTQIFTVRCVCGVIKNVRKYDVINGGTKSCGCLNREAAKLRATKHGAERTPEYRIWKAIKSRCNNPKHPHYRYYGGKGVRVCPEWSAQFELFLKHIGPRPSDEHSIDRINPDIGYEPGNVRWATTYEQAVNRGDFSNNTSGVKGVSYCKKARKWKAAIGVNGVKIPLGYFSDKNDAILARKNAEIKYYTGIKTK